MFKFFEMTGHPLFSLNLAGRWLRDPPLTQWHLLPQPKATGSCEVEQTTFLSFHCLLGEFATEFSHQLGLKGQAGLGAKGIPKQSWTIWVLH